MGRAMSRLIVVPLLSLLMIVSPIHVLQGRLALAAAAEDDPVKAPYQGLPEADRRAVQDALMWTGDFAGLVTGGYGARTRDAIAAYASKHNLAPAAVLDPAPRKALLAAAQGLRQAAGFVPVRDKRTAFLLSLPTRLLGKETATATGTHYSSPDGAIVVDTLSRPAAEGGLQDVFDRMSAASPQRKITYKLLKPDFFVVSGEIGERKFYARFAVGTAGEATLIRGFTLAYPKDAATRLDPLALAIAASFDPFPVPAGASGPPAIVGSAAPVTAPAAPAIDAQAVLVAPGVALSAVTSRNCPSPRLDNSPATFRVEDDASGLALLDVPGRPTASPPLAPGDVSDETAVVALFAGPLGAVYAAPGQARRRGPDDMSLTAPLQADSRGTPVFDRSGALLGVTAATKASVAIAGTLLTADYQLSGPVTIRKLLERAGLPTAAPEGAHPISFGDIVAQRRGAIGTISCSKQPPAAQPQ